MSTILFQIKPCDFMNRKSVKFFAIFAPNFSGGRHARAAAQRRRHRLVQETARNIKEQTKLMLHNLWMKIVANYNYFAGKLYDFTVQRGPEINLAKGTHT